MRALVLLAVVLCIPCTCGSVPRQCISVRDCAHLRLVPSRAAADSALRLRGGGTEPPGHDSDSVSAEGGQIEAEEDDVIGHVPEDAPASCPGTQAADAGKAASCEGCPNQAQCATGKGGELDPDFASINERMQSIDYKVLVLSGKGGVGKSTVASQLAMLLAGAEDCQSVEGGAGAAGLLDIDICGPSAPRMTGVEADEVRQAASGWQPVWVSDKLCVMSIGFMLPSRDDAVVWRGVRKNGLMKQFLKDVEWGALDYLVIDAPPGTSDEHITIAQCLNHTHNVAAVIVTTPQEMALLDVRKEINFCRKAGVRVLGIIENMAGFVCPHCNCTSDIFPASDIDMGGAVRGAEGMAARFGVPFLGRIPLETRLGQASEKGSSLQAGESAAARALAAVALEVRQRLRAEFGDPPSVNRNSYPSTVHAS